MNQCIHFMFADDDKKTSSEDGWLRLFLSLSPTPPNPAKQEEKGAPGVF